MASEARAKLEQFEAATDWRALVDRALADPPEPAPLFYSLNQWEQLFSIAHDGPALAPDYPPAVDGFIRRIAFCNVPEPFHLFVDGFVATHGRRPKTEELPPNLAGFVDTLSRPMRRPRCDTKRLRDAAKAWLGFITLHLYESNRELYRFFGRRTGATVKDFDRHTLATNSPSDLAEAKMAEQIRKPVDYVRKLLKDARKNRAKTKT